ncbi:J domain-containing protein [Bradyrhizobium sp. ARR65]|uniref:J domain-containing protein n=1 Tax=Bradyrhizobium sp. ARR65 TaxID=1040989 RepID=UPI000AF7061F
MLEEFKSWRMSLERLLSATNIDWPEAARLGVEIAGRSPDVILRQAATQAIPILRNAAQGAADDSVSLGAKRRLCIIIDVLQALTAPRFGMRRAAPKTLTAEERARKLLDLPLGKQLAVTDIRRAFRRAAKSVHPMSAALSRLFSN